ncbi:MAG: FAD-dependent monooxygenase [Actinobacteria bacterium]|nr:FAD-dependent monooxygenase [Actinomycetota bacterium]
MADPRDFPARVLIVGAGPTGSTTALALKKYAPYVQVTLIDKSSFPRDKACGDGLGPGARRTLERLGLTDLLDGFNRPISVGVTGPDGTEAACSGPLIGEKDLSGFVAPRLDFDNRLLQECIRQGVVVRTEERFKELEELATGQIRVISEDLRSSQMLAGTYEFVIAADGAYSAVRRFIKSPTAKKSKTYIAMRSYASISHPSVAVAETIRLDFIDAFLPAYGWCFPVSDGRANIGVGLPVAQLRNGDQSLRQLLDHYYDDLRRRGFKVGSPELVKSHQLPHAAARLRMAYGHVLFLGDAAATINPFSGEGIFYGMAAGVQLAEQLSQVSPGPDANWARELRLFEHAFKRRFRRHFMSSYAVHLIFKSRRWTNKIVRAAAKNREVMATGASIMFDEGTITPRLIFRALGTGVH